MQSGSRKNSIALRAPTVMGLTLAPAWLAVDQSTKWWIIEHVMDPPRVIPVTAFFNLVLGWNRGVSFGMLSGFALAPWMLAVLALVISGVLTVWLCRTHRWAVSGGLGLVIGGALSNAIDRLRYSAVTDFLDFHFGGWHWPAFNLADAGIVCGVVALMLDAFVRTDTSKSHSSEEPRL